ncbi:MAG: DUF4062 domain-containing protein, partial [Candidatus Lokiarchaeota archaeon]|nr:DUF4062 domain-containing protein [Candidatus Lokiarchaeota archaeon]
MVRVFVSSTYKDLKDYREQVIIALRRMKLDDVSMEYFVADAQKPVDKCLKDVASSDLYVGIFAWRYGSIPEGYDKSITELEYREALNSKKDCLIFLQNKSAEWPSKLKDDDLTKIENLRSEFKKKFTVDHFESPHDLACKVATSVYNWLIENKIISVEKPCYLFEESKSSKYSKIRDDSYKNWTCETLETRQNKDIFNRALSYYSEGNYRKSLEIFEKILKAKPDFAIAYFYKGDILADIGEYEAGVYAFDQGVMINSKNPIAWYNRGIILASKLKKFVEAIDSFNKAIEIIPEFDAAWAC